MIFSFLSQVPINDFSIDMNFCEVKAENHTKALDEAVYQLINFDSTRENKSEKNKLHVVSLIDLCKC